MRIALWDIVVAQKDRIVRLMPPGTELVDLPDAPASPVALDMLIASRFAARDTGRVAPRLLQVPGAGTDKVDFAAVPPAAFICNAYEHEQPISEYVFAAILDHATTYGAMVRRMPERGWGGAYFSRKPHLEVAGSTLGLIGLGHIGKAIAKRARAFDMKVAAVAATPRASAEYVDWVATADRLGEMLAMADYVVVACPLNDATRGMLGRKQFAQMKKTALLVNVARAEIAVEEDLFNALKDGVIAGAVLDPWYRYPASASDPVEPAHFPFGSLPNVRMTPHSSAWTDGVWARRCAFFVENLARLGDGRPLLNIVREPAKSAARAAG